MTANRSTSTKWAVAIAVALAFLLAYPLRFVLLPFVAAGALAYIARPLVNLMHRRLGFPRWLAALAPFLLFLMILSAIGYAIESMLVPQLAEMVNNAPLMAEKFLENLFQRFHLTNVQIFGQTLNAKTAADDLVNALKQAAGANALTAISGGIGAMMGCVITVVLFGFLLFTGPALARGALWLVPPGLRPRARSIAMEIDPMLGSYLRGVLVIVLFAALVTYVVTGLVFHVSHAIFLAVAVGLLETIPVIGPILSFVAFGLVAVQQKGMGLIIAFGVFAIVLRLTIDQVVGPLVLGRAARIPAIIVIFAFLVGGAVYGLLGVILAIPVAATIKIVLTDLYEGPPGPEPLSEEP
jgi:predicted PurR-regulated permease PerM